MYGTSQAPIFSSFRVLFVLLTHLFCVMCSGIIITRHVTLRWRKTMTLLVLLRIKHFCSVCIGGAFISSLFTDNGVNPSEFCDHYLYLLPCFQSAELTKGMRISTLQAGFAWNFEQSENSYRGLPLSNLERFHWYISQFRIYIYIYIYIYIITSG